MKILKIALRWCIDLIRNALACLIAAFVLVTTTCLWDAQASQHSLLALIESITLLLGYFFVFLTTIIIFFLPFYSLFVIPFMPRRFFESMKEKNINGKKHLFTIEYFPITPCDSIIAYKEFVKEKKRNFSATKMCCLIILMFLPTIIETFFFQNQISIFFPYIDILYRIKQTTILLWETSSISMTIHILFFKFCQSRKNPINDTTTSSLKN
ncbi:MAG: hypothetical protein MJZ76_05155 [Bacteroidales bacterium]|nr:hypothetical protein [Bacteroidales bacterium]